MTEQLTKMGKIDLVGTLVQYMNDSGFRPNVVFFQIVAIFINPTVSKTRYILHIMMTNREKDTRT